ncbi:MAG: lycopene cyclase domain-containing protein [Bacteroidales bacterium]|nr:lycopene cyclase domain-containing protein [Bacteroidales bacterium]
MPTVSTYLWINLLSLSIPLLLSFEPRFSFYRKAGAVLTAIIPCGSVFYYLGYPVYTDGGMGFQARCILQGIYFWHLPLGEMLFFVTIPYASLFTYEVVNYHFPADYLRKAATPIGYTLSVLLLVAGLLAIGRWYTSRLLAYRRT